MTRSSEDYYLQLRKLVAEMPTFDGTTPVPIEWNEWLGRASAILKMQGSYDYMKIDTCAESMTLVHLRESFKQRIAAILHRALAQAELEAPVSARGAFIMVDSPLDAFASVGKVMQLAKRDILIVDPYMDEKVVTDFAALAPDNVRVRLMTDGADHKPSFKPAVERWHQQFPTRALEARLAPAKSLHDRYIFLDGQSVWAVSQSFNFLAGRSPATIVEDKDGENAAKKVAYFESAWASATLIP